MRIKDLATRATKLLTGNAYMVFDNGTKVEKVDYAELAKQIITEYNTQTLAGSAQSVKSALDALNRNTVQNDKGGANAADYLQIDVNNTNNPLARIHDKTGNKWYYCPVTELGKTQSTQLWSGSTTLDGGTITLSSPVTNFTWLLFVFKTNNEIATCLMRASHATTEHPYAIIQAGEWVTDANRFQYCAWCSLTKTSDTTYDVTCKYNNQNFICKPGAVWGIQ